MAISKDELIDELLTRGVENIYPSRDFLKSRLLSGERLTVYLGADPSTPTLHIGHTAPLRKLALFQQLGHQAIFLMGDFTAMIGDPDKLSVRVPLSRDQVLANSKLYKDQVSLFVKFDGENPAQFKWNSEWLSRLTFSDVVSLASHMTVQQMLERDMFQRRIKEERPIYLHEFMYPLMQGYDSVAMEVDGEVGGNDQTFNMLAGRTLLRQLKGKEKFVITTKLLADTDGVKMGKTTGNMVSLTDVPEDMFGKIMSWSDGMIIPGFELCTNIPSEAVFAIQQELASGANPRDIKMKLAHEVVSQLVSLAAADKARDYFIATIQHKEIPSEIETVNTRKGALLRDLLLEQSMISSKSDFARLLKEGAVSVHIGDTAMKIEEVTFVVDQDMVVKVGKRRFLKINVS